MYSSGYKSGLQAQKKMQYRSKSKSCGYYMRIVFFFSSLIQSLIIVSLVLFLIYGKTQDSASISRIQDLEESFSRLSIENVALRQQRKNLTTLLNTTLTEKARNDWDLHQLRYFSNISSVLIQDIDKRLQQCTMELFMCKSQRPLGPCPPIQQPGHCNCGLLVEQLKARLGLVESNFTQTTQIMRMEMEQITKERDNLNLDAIRLRRDKSTHEMEIQFYKKKCRDDFVLSLSGVSNVTVAFLRKIDTLFPTHIAFQLTCEKQGEHLEQIRTNCTSLSREVEDKFQRYLDQVGEQVSTIQSVSSRLKAENWRLSEDYRVCSQNRTGMIFQHRQSLDKLQRKHDEDKEKLLLDKMKLHGQIDVLTNNVKYKTKEVEHYAERLRELNMTCMSKTGSNGFPYQAGTRQTGWGMSATGGSSSASSSSSGLGQFGRTGTGSSFSSSFNKPASTGTGSSSSSFPSLGSSSSSTSLFNKPASTGTGSSSSSFPSLGSSSSSTSLFNKPASTGTGSSSSSFSSLGSSSSSTSLFNKPASTGTGSSSSSLGSSSSSTSLFNKPASTGTGSSSSSFSSLGSSSSSSSIFNKPASTSFGSAAANPSLSSSGTGLNKPVLNRGSSTFGSSASSPSLSSSGTTLNKPTSNVRSPSTSGSSSSTATGSAGKTGSSSSGFGSWLGFGNSNPGPSKPGSGTGRGTSSGGYGGTGSSGRTGSGTVSVSQHLKDLQRLINPAGPEEKQDLSRVLG